LGKGDGAVPGFIKLTPSRVEEFERCPLLFKLAYVSPAGPRPAQSSPHLSFGKSIHDCLYRFHNGGGHQTHDLPSLLRLLQASWRIDGYAEDEERAAYWEEAVRVCESYHAASQLEAGTHLAHELFLDKRLMVDGLDVRISGKIDRLSARPEGLLEVIDYKTSRDTPSSPDLLSNSSAPLLYYLLARTSYPQYDRVVVSYLYLRKASWITVTYDEELGTIAKAQLKAAVHQIASGQFPPSPGAHCGWCDFSASCSSSSHQPFDLDDLV
jgi:putative RecB family exonuclease